MKKFSIPINIAIVLLAVFQIYSIYKYWGSDDSKVIISVIIFIGCLLLLLFTRFFKVTNNG